MAEAKPLWAVIGQQLRAAREANQWRQEDLASQARQYGLNWRRATVTAVEAGDREVGFEELILLSVLFQRPLSWWIKGNGLAEDERMEMVQLTSDAAAPRIGLVSLLEGASPAAETVSDVVEGPGQLRRWHQGLDVMKQWKIQAARWSHSLQERFKAERRRAAELWPEVQDDDLLAIRLAARHDAEMKAARSLQLSAFDVATLAVEKWGHGLTAERDRRLQQLVVEIDADARSAQARRGHVTRALIAELRTIKEERGL